jgi:hypothetical protein
MEIIWIREHNIKIDLRKAKYEAMNKGMDTQF